MIKGLEEWASQNRVNIENISQDLRPGKVLKKGQNQQHLIEPPMMYRAQIQGRCNLQFAGKNTDLEKWQREWLSLNNRYQIEDVEGNESLHTIEIKFPYRVLSNCGQDSILRPTINTYGVPFIPGSSIKGLFKRVKNPDYQHAMQRYCGTEDIPGTLRFHGAYPIGDWQKNIVDIVHPQQERQVKNNKPTSAYTLISFYEPKFLFEFSSSDVSINWQEVEQILRESLTLGLGGKTSTGYGFYTIPNFANPRHQELYQKSLHISLQGKGVSSLLLNAEPEFRPNMFKATLRGHLMRLLGGVCYNETAVTKDTDRLLGDTESEGVIKIFWETDELSFNPQTKPISYHTQGTLHLSADERAIMGDLLFVGKVLQFAYIMGGFGKSWRRVWHSQFKPDYKKFAIGCHWQSTANWLTIDSPDRLKKFLDDLYQNCQNRLGSRGTINYVQNWREVWAKERVAVYCSSKTVTKSSVIDLFHQEPFKTTIEISGKDRPNSEPKAVSYIWHRMLPVESNQYLEIVTIFHSPSNGQKFSSFIKKLQQQGLSLIWGKNPSIG